MKIALVTVLYNSDSVLEDFIMSLSIQNFKDYKLFLIDNSPNPTTDLIISNLINQYKIQDYIHLKSEYNVGVAKGNNIGIINSIEEKFDYTLLLNNDIVFNDPNLFNKLINSAVENNETLVIPKIMYYNTNKIWMVGGDFILNKGIIKHIGDNEEDQGQYDLENYYNYAPTCFMLIKNKLFDEIGLMDEKYFVYYDDTDFLFRAFLKNYKIKYLPTIKIFHKVSVSTGGNESAFSIYYSNRNRIYFILKNFHGLAFLKAITYTIITRFIKIINPFNNNKKVYLKALLHGFKLN